MADDTTSDRSGDLREYRVTVGSKPCIIYVSQTSAEIWTAVAEYDGEWLEATGASEIEAAAGWQQMAETSNPIVHS